MTNTACSSGRCARWAKVPLGWLNYGYVDGNDAALDSNNNLYVTGYFSGRAFFGTTTLVSQSSSDVFVAKYNASGTLLWVKQVTGPQRIGVNAMTLDGQGNVWLLGYTDASVTMGTFSLPGPQTGTAQYIAKLDSSGKWLWGKQFLTNTGFASSLATDASGNAYVTGGYRQAVDFGSLSLTPKTVTEIFVAKVNSNGSFAWVKSAGGVGRDGGSAIQVTSKNNIVIAGYFNFAIGLGATTLSSAGQDDIFVAKMNSSGNWIWAKRGGGRGYDQVEDLALDSKDNIFVSGVFQQTATFGTTNLTSPTNQSSILITKLDSNGNYLWASQGSGFGNQRAASIAIDSQDNAYLAGYFSSELHFGGNTLTTRGRNSAAFVAKIDGQGKWGWYIGGFSTQTNSQSWYNKVVLDSAGKLTAVGAIGGTSSFGSQTLQENPNGHALLINEVSSQGAYTAARSIKGQEATTTVGSAFYTDAAGNAYVSGFFAGQLLLGSLTLTTSNPRGSSFVAKVDNDGKWLWAQVVNSTDALRVQRITANSQGESYLLGDYTGVARFGALSLGSQSQRSDLFVAKLDKDGKWLWAKSASGTGTTNGMGMTLDSVGNLAITGIVRGDCSFGGVATLSAIGSSPDVFVAKMDKGGTWLWAKQAGSPGRFDFVNDVGVDGQDNIIITGAYYGSAIFGGTTLTNQGSSDVFVAKIDKSGTWLWAKGAGGAGYEQGASVAVQSNGNIYITGSTSSFIDFGTLKATHPLGQGGSIWVARLNSSGQWTQASTVIHSLDSAYPSSIRLDAQQNIYLSGNYRGRTNFGTDTANSPAREFNGFVAKLDPTLQHKGSRFFLSRKRVSMANVGIDQSGRIYVMGNFQFQVDFESVPLSAAQESLFVGKLSSF